MLASTWKGGTEPWPGTVKVVSVYFDPKHEMESGHAGLVEEESPLGAECSSACQDLRAGGWKWLPHTSCVHHSKQRGKGQTATRNTHLAPRYVFPVEE